MWFEKDGSDTLCMPSLDNVKGAIPMFDFDDKLAILPYAFDQENGYISHNDHRRQAWTKFFIILAVVLLILAIIACLLFLCCAFRSVDDEDGKSFAEAKQAES